MGSRRKGYGSDKMIFVAWIYAVVISICDGASVRWVEPHFGSVGGTVRLTIRGSGFAADQYSQNDDPNKGNDVYLVSDSGTKHKCPVHRHGSTKIQIMCHTPRGLKEENHYVKVVVNGIPVDDASLCQGYPEHARCTYRPSWSSTPFITALSPRSGMPGQLMTMEGIIFTDKFGSNNISTNLRPNRILRVFVGPHKCDLKKTNDKFYRLALDDDDSEPGTHHDTGIIVCKTKGTGVGFFNVSILIETPFGRSVTKPSLYRLSSNDKIYLYQIYTEITSISHSVGSKAGGLTIAIYGKYFDDRFPYTKPKAFVGDTICEITKVVVDSHIECIVAADPQYSRSQFEGSRGVNFESWTSHSDDDVDDLSNILLLTSSDSGHNSETLDMMQFYDDSRTNYASKMTSYFKPPHTGDYQFVLKANDKARLFVEDVEEVTSHGVWKWSSRMTLYEDRQYLLQVVHYQTDGDSYVYMKIKYYNTTLTPAWISKAEWEEQTIRITSTVKFEVQTLAFQSFPGQDYTKEVQLVEVDTQSKFRFGMYGVYTGPLHTAMSNRDVQQELKVLPIWNSQEFITVERDSSSGNIYELTFYSRRGDFPDIEVIPVDESSYINYSVIQDTRGVPDLDTVALVLGGIVSAPFSVSSLDAVGLTAIIKGMFGAKCPSIIDGESNSVKYYQSFEEQSSKFIGEIIDDTDAFCGRYSLKNPERIFQKGEKDRRRMLSSHRQLCFAYKGYLQSMIGVRYSYKYPRDRDVHTDDKEFEHTFTTDDAESWHYTCVDLYSLVTGENANAYQHELNEVWVYRQNSDFDVYVDSVYIGQGNTIDDPEPHLVRLPPAQPNNVHIDEVIVSLLSAGVYEVTLKPFDCGYDLPLFELANGAIISGTTDSSSTSAELALDNGDGSGVMTVARWSAASPPVTGSFGVNFKEHTASDLHFESDALAFGKELESLEGIGAVDITINGDCANSDRVVTFRSLPGDLPQMELNIDGLAGIDVDGDVITGIDGGVYHDPITGDMLSTVHLVPQVRLYINDVLTTCAGDDCSFQWDSSVTPIISSVDPQTGTLGLSTSIVISGSGFSAVSSDNTVTIGGVECVVTSAGTTSITCDVGNGPEGPYPALVLVKDKGYASGNIHFTYIVDIQTLTPTSGSLGGGLNLAINGYGFKSGDSVSINSQICKLVSLHADEIICVIPASKEEGTFDVVVDQRSSSISFSGYTYDLSITARVSSIVPATIGVTGASITISGESFTSVFGSVFVGSQAATVVSWSDSEIVIKVGDIEPGIHEIKTEAANGFAVDDSTLELPVVNVDLIITNVYPLQGSLSGGTQLTVTGSGFGADYSSVAVTVGTIECIVFTLTDSQIVCEIDDAVQVHIVTNEGVDPDFGATYAFDKPFITINQYDVVQWYWNTPEFVNAVHYVVEVSSPSRVTQKIGGFSSGTPSRKGQFRRQFKETGISYVSSGCVDKRCRKRYFGTIKVVLAISSAGLINVRVGQADAMHAIGGASDPVDTSDCNSVTFGKQDCSDSKASANDPSRFNFVFWTCSTPIVNSVSVNTGTTHTPITIIGDGFSATACQNEVSFGGYQCEVISPSSEESLTCKLANSGEPELGILHQLELRVNNRGNARIHIHNAEDRGFAVIPNIENITPTSGSIAGGARLTITGFGFGDLPLVTIDDAQCSIIESSYSEIICKTPTGTAEEYDVVVYAYINGYPLQAKCETQSSVCTFTYMEACSPTILTINSTSMSTTTTFKITGTLFGIEKSVLDVTIGGVPTTVIEADNSYILVTVDDIPAGDNDVSVRIKDCGEASGSLVVYGTLSIINVSPPSGSVHGDTTIVIAGTSFASDKLITVGGEECDIVSTSLSEVTCITKAHAAGSVNVTVTSNGISFSTPSYNYEIGSTPTISYINPTFGFPGDTLIISGLNLNGGVVSVLLGNSVCDYISGTSTEIQCTIGNHPTGLVNVFIHVQDLGASNSDIQFEYELSISSITPTHGSTAGSQTVVITGTGFHHSADVAICGQTCTEAVVTSTSYTCKTPANPPKTCNVVISLNDLIKTLPNAYTYEATVTSISGVSPRRGGTGGGTTLTISGLGFGDESESVSVMIDGATCVVAAVTNTEIECVTGPHIGSSYAKVQVEISENGIAEESAADDSKFQYIDVWSSNFTWGGGPLPQVGDFIVIPAGMTLLLDTDTPVLSFLLIQGGTLIFDEQDVELQADIIMITDGGSLVVGTEEEPFQHKAIITMHGNVRKKELPVYGTKVIAVRNGTLDLHGIVVPVTWTLLSSTAEMGSDTIMLQHPVEWNVGDEIIIASTGNYQSQSENEKKKIYEISSDKMTLTLDSPLTATHVSVEETFAGQLVEMRAEVGLLTHNVIVRGSQDDQWEDDIQACEEGFEVGEFETQTCFQGRFGDETGSSEFGATIHVHSVVPDTHEVQARISYVEVYYAGQAFRLGRYPIHFHLNGDMSTSYVTGCSIHKTFNRAINIHGSHNTLIEKTVIYNIMGGAFFLEDGIETGNTLQYNLAVFVIASSSLLNDDITPAAFWLLNGNNTVQHNHVASGTHFGYWYRLFKHPDGPSYTEDICPENVPMGVFRNNSVHSSGWFGLWVFENYFPLKGGCGGTEVEPGIFESLLSWNNGKGVQIDNFGSVQFNDFILIQNRFAGFEGKKVWDVPYYTAESPMVRDSLIVGTTTVHPDVEQGCTRGGIVLPFGRGFRVVNVAFVNFNEPTCATFRVARIFCVCSDKCGGYTYHTESLTFENAPNKAFYEWDWEFILLDKDGTATGKPADWTVLPTTGTLPSDCEHASEFSIGNNASMCPPQHKWHRFAFNNIEPVSLVGMNFIFENQHGNSSVPYMKKHLTHEPGWMCALLEGEIYSFGFENAAEIGNISFSAQFDDFQGDEHLFFKWNVRKLPDRLTVDDGKEYINATTVGDIDPYNAHNGDWEWDDSNSELKVLVSARNRWQLAPSLHSTDRAFEFRSFNCYYTDCIAPEDRDAIEPVQTRPTNFDYWESETIWYQSNDGYMTNGVSNGTELPRDYEDVRIVYGSWIMVNRTIIAKLGVLLIEGVLEFADTPGAIYQFEADAILIKGGRLVVGWPDDPFDGLASFILRGSRSSPDIYLGDGATLGSKVVGVFGGLDLYGIDVAVTWTQLATTANAGSDIIVLAEQIHWSVGDEIVLGPTSFDPWQTESFAITSIDSDNATLTLNDTLKFKHIAHSETLSNGVDISVGAAVGLLSHNIKIIGEDYESLYQESFGARVIVGQIFDEGYTYTGYARLSNVEFYHTGQHGYTDEYDPRFSVAYVDVGAVTDIKPSFVTKCSFHNGFNTAVGVFGTDRLNVIDNVVFGSIGTGLRTNSNETRIANNLVALMVATNRYQGRLQPFNPRWEAGIDAIIATELTLQDNLVTASEQIAFHVPTLECDDTSDRYRNNRMYANVLGAVIFPGEADQIDCAKMSGFVAWKSYSFGLYYQDSANFLADDNALIENQNGILAIVFGPHAAAHLYADKRVTIRNSTFVGQTSSFDCDNDRAPSNDDNFDQTGFARPSLPPSSGMVGVVFPNYYSAPNGAPLDSFIDIMTYNAIGGLSTLSHVTFAKYNNKNACKQNYAVTTNSGNDDGQHPIHTESITLDDIDVDNKVLYHRPHDKKITPHACVDMDCDAFKKALIKDLDGTFLGHIGSVIPESEYEWDGDPKRGLGDYRIPKEMVTMLDGTRIPYKDIVPYKGIVRNDNCIYHTSWQAYECMEELNYEMLIIESMDDDTELRRLSPVAILSDGYVDLINGPQNHVWFRRLSTFMALVATEKNYLLHFTSTTPVHMRYRLLNVDANEAIKLTVWNSRPNRLDVFVNGTFRIAINAAYDENKRYILTAPTGDEFEPQITDETGTNYFDKKRGEITVIIKGPELIDVITQATIIIAFGLPDLTVEEFFGDNLIENVALLLDIPLTKVRIMSVVSASGSRRRRKRSGSGINVEIEIGDGPLPDINATLEDSIDYSSLKGLTAVLVNKCEAGNISQTLNMTLNCLTVELPSTDLGTASIVYNTTSPDHLFFYAEPVAEYEGVLLKIQPRIRVADIDNYAITELGTAEYPWQLIVSVRDGTGHPSTNLTGTLTVNCSAGWFNFTDLAISHMATNYILDFNVTYPAEAENFTLASDPFDVPQRPLKINVYDKTSGDILKDGQFSLTLDLRDENTDVAVYVIDWRHHVWSASVNMLVSSPFGAVVGTPSASFDLGTGRVIFPDLSITGFGIYYLQLRVVSDPEEFNLTLNHKITIKNPAHVGMAIEDTSEVKMKFYANFSNVLPTVDKQNAFEQFILTKCANLYPAVQLSVGSIYEGSIVVTFVIAGSYTDVNDTAYAICDGIYNGTQYDYNGYALTLAPYLTINDQTYYGVTCGDMSSNEEDEGMAVYLIVIIVMLSLLVALAIAAVVVWKCTIKPKTKTRDMHSGDTVYHDRYTSKSVTGILYQEQSFASMGFNTGHRPAMDAGISCVNEKRLMSNLSVNIAAPKIMNLSQMGVDRLLTPPPMPYGAASYAGPGSQSPGVTRAHSFEGRESPLPPVGDSLYHGDYITTPIPMSTTPHVQAPSPTFGRRY